MRQHATVVALTTTEGGPQRPLPRHSHDHGPGVAFMIHPAINPVTQMCEALSL